LEVERCVWSQAAGLAQPGQKMFQPAEATEFATGKNVNVIDAAIAAEERRPFWVYDPGDLGLWVSVANQGRRRQGVDDIA
jgi:transketolase C-terminal domain/subunit